MAYQCEARSTQLSGRTCRSPERTDSGTAGADPETPDGGAYSWRTADQPVIPLLQSRGYTAAEAQGFVLAEQAANKSQAPPVC